MALTLYDGSPGTAPQDQGELILRVIGLGENGEDPSPLDTFSFVAAGGEELLAAGGVLIDSTKSFTVPVNPPYTAVTGYVGYSNYNLLAAVFVSSSACIVQSSRFSLHFAADLTSTSTNSNHRRSFSILAMGANNLGIELAWDNDDLIFAQDVNFNRAEFVDVSPIPWLPTPTNRSWRISATICFRMVRKF